MLDGCVPWPADLAARYRAAGLWEGLTIFEMVERTAAGAPEKIAVVHEDRRISYAELVSTAAHLGAAFWRLGIRRLDRVVVQLPNGLDFVYVYLALTRIGAIPVMALRAHRHAEVEHFIKASGAVAYVIADVVSRFDYREMAAEMQAKFPALRHVIVAGEPAGQVALAALLRRRPTRAADGPPIPRPDPAEVATMLLSGGTTSMSKLIPRTHDDYVLNARLCAQAAGFGPATVLLAILPLGHNYNLASPGMLGAFYAGGTVVIAGSTDTDDDLLAGRARAGHGDRGGRAADLELAQRRRPAALRPVVARGRAERRRAPAAGTARAPARASSAARRRRSTAPPKA